MSPEGFRLVLRRSARKDVLGLAPKISEQVERTLDRLLAAYSQGRRPQDARVLRGQEATFRIDTGEYRILYTVDQEQAEITVFRIRHRKDVYRNL